MPPAPIRGRTWTFGDDINTDVIVAGRYLAGSPEQAGAHVMEAIRPEFPQLLEAGDIICGGRNFGTGSSRELAVTALQARGVAAVVAVSFARIFFRNCINAGLAPVECAQAGSIEEGQHVSIDLAAGRLVVDETGVELAALRIPDGVREILDAGGLEKLLARRLG